MRGLRNAMTRRIILLGAGGAAIELAEALIEAARGGAGIQVLGFLDDDPHARGLPEAGLGGRLGALDDAHRFSDASFMLAVVSHRNMRAREAIIARLGLTADRFHTFVHPSAQISPSAQLAPGVAVMASALVGPRVRIDAHAWVSMGCCIGHDSLIGARTVIAPRATVSGRVRVGDGAYVGAAAAIAPDLAIGARSLVGIGSVVIDPVAEGAMVFGNPARVVDRARGDSMRVSAGEKE